MAYSFIRSSISADSCCEPSSTLNDVAVVSACMPSLDTTPMPAERATIGLVKNCAPGSDMKASRSRPPTDEASLSADLSAASMRCWSPLTDFITALAPRDEKSIMNCRIFAILICL